MRRSIILIALLAAGTAAAEAAPPALQVYVTEQNADVYVALFDRKAVELAGCTNATDAKRLLHQSESTETVETTLAKLKAENAYGEQLRLPCPGKSFDLDWPAATPIWADVERSGNYYLPAPPSHTGYYAVPAACTEIKATLAIRERLQLPGVLQGFLAPSDLGSPIVLDCGRGDLSAPVDAGSAGAAQWSLHRFETFLSAESIGDTIYVARYTPPGKDSKPSYLPVLRLDGRSTRDLIVEGGAAAEAAEAKLRDLFGISRGDPVTLLGAEAVAALRSAVYVDLCLTNCASYRRTPAAFGQPGVDLGLSELRLGITASSLDPLGNARLDWTYAEGRGFSFTDCPLLMAALGLTAPAIGDWMAETERALKATGSIGTSFDCRGSARDTCTRRLSEGDALTPARFAAGDDCAGRTNLRLELPASVKVPQALVLKALPFTTARLAPAPGIARARLITSANRIPAGTASCVLASTGVLIAVDGLSRLELQQIDLARASGPSTDEVVGLLAQNSILALEDVTIGAAGEGLTTLPRGISLCVADLYASNLKVEADMLAVQAVRSRLLLFGRAPAHSTLTRARYGAILSSDSRMRMDFTEVAAANPLVLRGAQVAGRSDSLTPMSSAPAAGSGVQLERNSSASFTTSTVAGFHCAVSFADDASSASFLLPGNDIAHDNTNRACGPGRFSLIE
jgi:hypothetical protein